MTRDHEPYIYVPSKRLNGVTVFRRDKMLGLYEVHYEGGIYRDKSLLEKIKFMNSGADRGESWNNSS